jgi:cholesterol transport system auxiliary component
MAGCGKQEYSKQRYWLDIQRPKANLGIANGTILAVEPFSIDSAFRTRSIVYKKTSHEYESDFYQEYLIPPAQMMTEQTRRWLGNSGLCARVLQPGSTMQPTHILEGHIGKLYIDSSADGQSVANLEISFYLLKKEKRDEQILFGKTYTASKQMESSATEDYFRALKNALTEILRKSEEDLGKRFQQI